MIFSLQFLSFKREWLYWNFYLQLMGTCLFIPIPPQGVSVANAELIYNFLGELNVSLGSHSRNSQVGGHLKRRHELCDLFGGALVPTPLVVHLFSEILSFFKAIYTCGVFVLTCTPSPPPLCASLSMYPDTERKHGLQLPNVVITFYASGLLSGSSGWRRRPRGGRQGRPSRSEQT